MAEGFENRKYFQVDGEAGARVFDAQIKFEEAGDYEVKAVLIRNDESTFVDSTTVMVR